MAKTNAERQKEYRKRNAPCNEIGRNVTEIVTKRNGVVDGNDLAPFNTSPCDAYYVPRSNPGILNWGEWMDVDELKQNGFKVNRVSIPGDWDYVGCVC